MSAAAALTFRQVSAGDEHTCGVTTDDRAYCWGDGFSGKVGDGSFPPEFCMDWDQCISRPVAVVGGLRFRVVSAGGDHTCGVTTDDRAYCWGANAVGQLGMGNRTGPETCVGNESSIPCSPVPVAVAGGIRFRGVSAGRAHTCGITTGGQAYCWGWNGTGQLGDGTTSTRTRPTPVAGARTFTALSAGSVYTCGLTADNLAYCWGYNGDGQLGDSSRVTPRLRPVRVAGGRKFRQLDAGASHTCATTSTDLAFCWGQGDAGQLGTGGTSLSTWPRRVTGGLSFDRVVAGHSYTCAEATSNRAYCWGSNLEGQFGNGTRSQSLAPVAAGGSLLFAQLTAGKSHTCGRTAAGTTYCWGRNRWGQLGDDTEVSRLTPVQVRGPS